MSRLPAPVQCRCLLADGTTVTLTATRRERAGRADVKCMAPGELAARMQQVVRLARHTEPRFDSRDQVVVSLEGAVAPGERGWELAAVLADRMARGLYQASGPVVANGWSDHWQLGRVDGHTLRVAPQHVLLGGADGLPHLGALTGHPDPSSGVSSARAWFPLHSGGTADSLCWVEVSVFPTGGESPGEEGAISVAGLDLALQHEVRQALCGARHFDGRATAGWRTTVRFGEQRFLGRSYELALVMADRIARGREFLPRGRILATGCSGAWHAGRVDPVDGIDAKCALMAREAAPGDRILLPKAWQGGLPPDFETRLRARGASLACVERIGIL